MTEVNKLLKNSPVARSIDMGRREGLVQPVPKGARVLRVYSGKDQGKFGGFSFEPNYEPNPVKQRAASRESLKNYRKFKKSLPRYEGPGE